MPVSLVFLVAAVASSAVSALRLNEPSTELDTNEDTHPVISMLLEEGVSAPTVEYMDEPGRLGRTYNATEAKVEVFVINLKRRKDRWDCARQQLEGAPYPVSRFDAVDGDQVRHKCPYLKGSGIGQGPPAQGVMCSNYLIWKQARQSNADFIIILEDDFLISDKFWERVKALVDGECSGSFDFAAVDTFSGTSHNRKAIHDGGEEQNRCTSSDKSVHLRTLVGGGAHMEILRVSALDKMIRVAEKKPDLPVDRLSKKFSGKDIRTAAYQAKIVAQAKSASIEGLKLPEYCSKHVGKSDIVKLKNQ